MEKAEFITEAKKLGMEDSVIQEKLSLYDAFVKEWKDFKIESLLAVWINPSDIHVYYSGV
jgi:hypothetical protein